MAKPTMHDITPRFKSIINRLHEEYIEQSDDLFLPSVHELAAKYRTSKTTILKAIHILREKSLVSCNRGMRTMIIRPGKIYQDGKSISESARILSAKIKNEIVSGNWKPGIVLPKYDYFRIAYRLSFDSILEALKSLESEGIVHKMGKKWISGPSPDFHPASSCTVLTRKSRTAFVVLPSYEAARDILRLDNNHYYAFLHTFMYEIEHLGHQVALGYCSFGQYDSAVPAGESRIQEFIRGLGESRYMGTLIRAEPGAPLIRWLVNLKKPVVTFHLRPPLECYSFASSRFAHCEYDEEGAVRLALDELAARGHRVIAVIEVDRAFDVRYKWINLRAEMIRKVASASYPGCRIITIIQKEKFLFVKEWRDSEHLFGDFLRKHCARGGKIDGLYRRALMAYAPSLSSIVNHPEITALIAPNDLFARLYYLWLKEAGVSVPGDLSLISFDNDFCSHNFPFPLTTIDLNMSMLGYQVAHFMAGDIPIVPTKDRTIKSRCSFIDRGSIGAPNPQKKRR